MTGKYEPLRRLLVESLDHVSLSFADLDDLVGGLPASAREHRTWWGNTVKTTSSHASAWVGAGYVVESIDMAGEMVRFVAGVAKGRGGTGSGTRTEQILDGIESLASLIRAAGYPTTMHAVAAHTVFLHPETVAQTTGAPLFPIIRDFDHRGEIIEKSDGSRLLLDDNTSPTLAFCWAAQSKKGPDIQFNHVYSDSKNPAIYTALWNLCVTPAFLAKTTDGKNHPDVVAAIQYRSYVLYGFVPGGDPIPVAPVRYEELKWPESPNPVDDLEAVLRRRMAAAKKSRPARAAREIGWLFSGGEPDSSVFG